MVWIATLLGLWTLALVALYCWRIRSVQRQAKLETMRQLATMSRCHRVELEGEQATSAEELRAAREQLAALETDQEERLAKYRRIKEKVKDLTDLYHQLERSLWGQIESERTGADKQLH